MVAPTTDVETTSRQQFQTKSNEIPNFPYTNTPILPREVYQSGFTGKEGVQMIEGVDPIQVVKVPVLYRRVPAGTGLPADSLRSTWVLMNGQWTQVEDRVPPLQQAERFDQWVERACFQYHRHVVSVPLRSITFRGDYRPGPSISVPITESTTRS